MSFGTRLQELRRSHGITQEQFAQQLNVSRQAVSKWESSRGYPEMEKILYICSSFGVRMDELFADEIPSRGSGEQGDGVAPGRMPDSPTLKQSLSNFVTNRSPQDRWAFIMWVACPCIAVIALLGLLCATVAKGEGNDMTMKLIWLALLILFGVGEAITVGLTSVWFALGALGALLCALAGGNIWVQVGAFLLLSGLALALARPLARRFLTPGYSATNADRVIGRTAVVVQDIDNLRGQGQVTIAGQIWTARSHDGEAIPAGVQVKVLRIEGVKVFVTCECGKE